MQDLNLLIINLLHLFFHHFIFIYQFILFYLLYQFHTIQVIIQMLFPIFEVHCQYHLQVLNKILAINLFFILINCLIYFLKILCLFNCLFKIISNMLQLVLIRFRAVKPIFQEFELFE